MSRTSKIVCNFDLQKEKKNGKMVKVEVNLVHNNFNSFNTMVHYIYPNDLFVQSVITLWEKKFQNCSFKMFGFFFPASVS